MAEPQLATPEQRRQRKNAMAVAWFLGLHEGTGAAAEIPASLRTAITAATLDRAEEVGRPIVEAARQRAAAERKAIAEQAASELKRKAEEEQRRADDAAAQARRLVELKATELRRKAEAERVRRIAEAESQRIDRLGAFLGRDAVIAVEDVREAAQLLNSHWIPEYRFEQVIEWITCSAVRFRGREKTVFMAATRHCANARSQSIQTWCHDFSGLS